MSFTKGPWYCDVFGNIWRREPSELYENGGGVAGDKPLAVAYKGWHLEGQNGYPVEANAALIADAPALLEALESIVSDFEGCYADGEPAIIKARALIAKHRGQS